MKIKVLTLFKESFNSFLNSSIISRIIEKGLIEVELIDIRDYAYDKHRHVDDSPYGGGAGMLLRIDCVANCLKDHVSKSSHVCLITPQAKPFNQQKAYKLSKKKEIILICGHYEGIDSRIENYVDENLSIGDYVLTQGEIAAQVIIDACARLIDGAIDAQSLKDESYTNSFLEYKQYTRPVIYDDLEVPFVVRNGNHKEIEHFKKYSSISQTIKHRPDLLKKEDLSKDEIKNLDEFINKYGV